MRERGEERKEKKIEREKGERKKSVTLLRP